MPNSSVDSDFIGKFSEVLTQRLSEELQGAQSSIEPDFAKKIAERFIDVLMDFKQRLSKEDVPINIKEVKGEVSLGQDRPQFIRDFSESLKGIFSEIGGMSPGDKSAFWSGRGLDQARKAGHDLEATVPGFVINKVFESLRANFAQKAYVAENSPEQMLDTALILSMWESMSLLYAQGTFGDANIYLVDGETSQHSVLWNTELYALRQQQGAGEGKVKTIWVNTLNPESLKEYKELLAKKGTTNEGSEERQHIDHQISVLLENKDNWVKSALDKSTSFKIKISGFTEEHKTVSYQNVKHAVSLVKHFADNRRARGKDSEAYLEEKFNQPLDRISTMIAEKKDPAIILQELTRLKSQIENELKVTKTMDDSLIKKLQDISNIISSKIELVSATSDQKETVNVNYLEDKYQQPLTRIRAMMSKNPEMAFLELKILRNQIRNEQTSDASLKDKLEALSGVIAGDIETAKSAIVAKHEETQNIQSQTETASSRYGAP